MGGVCGPGSVGGAGACARETSGAAMRRAAPSVAIASLRFIRSPVLLTSENVETLGYRPDEGRYDHRSHHKAPQRRGLHLGFHLGFARDHRRHQVVALVDVIKG